MANPGSEPSGSNLAYNFTRGVLIMKSTRSNSLRIVRVHSDRLRDEVFSLRYHAYRKLNLIAELDGARFADKYDDQRNCIIWALMQEDRPIGSIRVTYYDPRLPSLLIPEMDCYYDDLGRAGLLNYRLASGNRFVIHDPDIIKDRVYSMILLRFYMVSAFRFADYSLAAVRAKHLKFYNRVMRLQKISEAKLYPGLLAMMYLTACDFRKNIFNVCDKNPLLRPIGVEQSLLDENRKDCWEQGLEI